LNLQFKIYPECIIAILQPVSKKQNLITGLNYKVWDVEVAEQANPTDVKATVDAVQVVVIV